MERIPNAISVLRALCAVPVVLLVAPETAVFALALFAAAALTDALDGALARRIGAASAAGALLDPLADKILVLGTLAGLVGLGAAAAAPVALILARETLVTAARALAMSRGTVVPASRGGKAKAVLQGAAVAALLAAVAWPDARAAALADALLWATALVTLVTGAAVLRRVSLAVAVPAPLR